MKSHYMEMNISKILLQLLWLLIISQCTVVICGSGVRLSNESFDYIAAHKNTKYIDDIIRRSKAAEMRIHMNETIDPCENFYQFACGNWPHLNAADQSGVNNLMNILIKSFNARIQSALEADTNSSDMEEIEKNAIDFYESCMNMHTSGAEYRMDQLYEIANEFGGLPPVLMKDNVVLWNEREFNWLETAAKIIHKYAIYTIIKVFVATDHHNSTRNVLIIGDNEFLLRTPSAYLGETMQLQRHAYMKYIGRKLQEGLGVEAKLAEQTAKELLDFEIALAEGLQPDDRLADIDELYIPTTLMEMHRKYSPHIDIAQLVNITFGESDPNYHIYEHNSKYQENLVHVMRNYPKRVVANYMFYQLYDKFLVLPQSIVAKQQTECMEETKRKFTGVLDTMIYRSFRNNQSESDLHLIFDELRAALQENIQLGKYTWMQAVTRQNVIEKLKTMQFFIYGIDNVQNDNNQLSPAMDKNNYIENLKKIFQNDARKLFHLLHTINDDDSPMRSDEAKMAMVTPINILEKNRVSFPIIFLQPYRLLDIHYPYAIKFGSVATIVGHEIVHAFDDSGRLFDVNRNLNNMWDAASTEAFDKRKKCFIEQYSKYMYNGRYLHRTTDQRENIADNSGIRLAYAAYLNWLQASGNVAMSSEVLPNFNYTNKQLFFISFAQLWCSDIMTLVKAMIVAMDKHTPDEYRVIGSLSNFDEFAKAFNCPAGSKMNPQEKCVIY